MPTKRGGDIQCAFYCGCVLCIGLLLLPALFLFVGINVTHGRIYYHILADSNSTNIDNIAIDYNGYNFPTDSNSSISLTTTYVSFVWPNQFIKVACYPHGRFDECEYLAQHKDDITKKTFYYKNGNPSHSQYSVIIYPYDYDQSADVVAYWMIYRVITAVSCLFTAYLWPIPLTLLILEFVVGTCCNIDSHKNCNWSEILIEKPKYLVIPYFTAFLLWCVALIMIFCPTNYELSYKYSARSVLEKYFDNNPNDLIVSHDDIIERAHGIYILVLVIFGFYFVWFVCYWLLAQNVM